MEEVEKLDAKESLLPHEDKERDVAYEHAHVAHLNIFRPIHGHRDKVVRVSGSYDTQAGKVEIEVMMPNQLSIEDEDLLLAIYSLARPIHHTDEVTTQDDIYNLAPRKHKPQTISIHTSKYEILEMIGKNKGGKNYGDLLKSLKRISETSISYASKKCKGTTFLLSFCNFDDEGVAVTLNPLSALILLGVKAPYIRYVREDRQVLPNGIPRRIHSIFSASLNKGRGSIGLYPLAAKIHGDTISPDQIKRLKKSLKILPKKLAGWRVSVRGRGQKAMVYYRYNSK